MAMLILYCTFRKGRIIMFTRYCLEKGNRYYMGGTNDKRRRQGSGNRHADGRVDDIEYFSYRLDDGPDEENIEEIEKKEKKRKNPRPRAQRSDLQKAQFTAELPKEIRTQKAKNLARKELQKQHGQKQHEQKRTHQEESVKKNSQHREESRKSSEMQLKQNAKNSSGSHSAKQNHQKNGKSSEKKEQMKKKALFIAGGVLGAAALVYLGFAFYFTKHFYFNTTINGNDFSGKTVKEAESYMEKQVQGYTLTLKENDGGTEVISGEDISLEYLPGKELEKIVKDQNAFLWIRALFQKGSAEAKVDVQYDEAALDALISGLQCMKPENQTPSVSAKPTFDGNTFVITKEVEGTQLDQEVFRQKIKEKISGFQHEMDLEKEGCYLKPKFTEDSPEVVAARDKMNSYLGGTVTYQMGATPEGIDNAKLAEWITVDENMNVTFTTDGISAYVRDLASRYDTVGKTRSFTTPTGKAATVSGGTYGWSIDEPAEIEQLKADIAGGKPVQREPIYEKRAASFGATDWGNTYAEVDLSAQHMWYIQNGNVVLETDIVSGFPTPDRITPEGVYDVLYKESPSVLVGEKDPETGQPIYETEVRYWMQFTWSGVGFHDADWQPAFGGSLYQSAGSHGCINMPIDKAGQLLNLISAGVPVICHY